MTLYLLIVHLQTCLSIPVTQKCQFLSCDTIVAIERYVYRVPIARLTTRQLTNITRYFIQYLGIQ